MTGRRQGAQARHTGSPRRLPPLVCARLVCVWMCRSRGPESIKRFDGPFCSRDSALIGAPASAEHKRASQRNRKARPGRRARCSALLPEAADSSGFVALRKPVGACARAPDPPDGCRMVARPNDGPLVSYVCPPGIHPSVASEPNRSIQRCPSDARSERVRRTEAWGRARATIASGKK